MSSTEEVFDIAQSAEAESAKKKSTVRSKKDGTKKSTEVEADGELDVALHDSGSDCSIV